MTKSKLNLAGALLAIVLSLPPGAAASGPALKLDRAPVNIDNRESLQRGAAVFVNYCLNCHSANYMRYNRMTDFGLTEAQIKDNLLFAAEKPGETMRVSMRVDEAKAWFGAPPPDLTVIARSRGADWIYTYLRGFYRDDSRPLGWNNTLFANVGMPHVMHELQGQMAPVFRSVADAEGKTHQVIDRLQLVKPGKLTLAEYDALAGDLVNYLVWMGEPAQGKRQQVGLIVLIFLGLFFLIAFYLKREYWKDIH